MPLSFSSPATRATLVLLLFLVLPSLLLYLLPVSSMAWGVLAACLIVICLSPWRIGRRHLPTRYQPVVLVVVLTSLVVHFLIAALLQPVDVGRFSGSLGLMLIFLVTCVALGPMLFNKGALLAVRRLFYGMLICAATAAVGLRIPGIQEYTKPVFPFTEPSLFGLAFLPLLMWMCVTEKGWRRLLWLAAGVVVALLLESLTTLVGILIIAGACVPWKRGVACAFITGMVLLLFSPDLTYYADRLALSTQTENLSALVYLQGWEMLIESLQLTYGWGRGFQQLGVNGTSVEAAGTIFFILGTDSNLLEGGFLFAKLISEFGIFGFVGVALYIPRLIKSFLVLKDVALRDATIDVGTVLAHAVIVCYVVEMFVRSAGYFVGTGVLFVAAMMHVSGPVWTRRAVVGSRRRRSAQNSPTSSIVLCS